MPPTSSSVEMTVLEVESSALGAGGQWWVGVREAGGREVVRYAGGVKVFPAAPSLFSHVTSLPLTVEMGGGGGGGGGGGDTGGPQRVWLAFRAPSDSQSTLTLRCGEQVSTDLPASGNTTQSNNTTTSSSSGGPSGHKSHTPSVTGVTEPTQKDTTDIIIYTAVGVSALLVLSFLYVCLRKIHRKGCPPWCPGPCRHLECGADSKDKPATDPTHHPAQPPSTTTTTNININNNNNDANRNNSNEDKTKAANGSATRGNGDLAFLENEFSLATAFHQREFKRHRSMVSLHVPSLANIRESEEECRFSTSHQHSNMDLLEAFRIVGERLASIHPDNTHPDPGHPDHKMEGDAVEEEEEEEEGRPVVFQLGSHESSDPDLEEH
ncbi:uncharacterized protein LOC143298165 isoform X2 [Babylonia areolata]|uniref:uncharacterized protein LOC143298165 isoform X2 n=1 Tax=Babylonia areolata TaxID=304850 RepID=UPI003FD0A4C8